VVDAFGSRSGYGRVLVLFISVLPIHPSQALIVTRIVRFLDRSWCILFTGFELVLFDLLFYGTSHMQCFCNSWCVRNVLVMALRLNTSVQLAESIVSLHPHQAVRAQHQLASISAVYTPLLACRQQCQEKTPFHCPNFSCRKMFTSDSWRLKHIKLHYPEHIQVARQRNLTICSAHRRIEPAQGRKFNAYKVSVEHMDMIPYLKHVENIADSRYEPPSHLLMRTESYPAAGAPRSDHIAE